MSKITTICMMIFVLAWSCTAVLAEKRVALVVGNGNYQHTSTLLNPANDAALIATKFKSMGYTVVHGVDVSNSQFRVLLREFAKELQTASTGVFFYAGHGLQVAGKNYLVPIDAQISIAADLRWQTIELQAILDEMQNTERTSVLLLDACRDNPLSRSIARALKTRSSSVGQGLARVSAGSGTFVGFATAPGETALDGDGKNSPFTTALAKHITTPKLDISVMMRRVRLDVMDQTNKSQVPWSNSSLCQDFQFSPKQGEPISQSSAKKDDAVKLAIKDLSGAKLSATNAWNATQSVGTCSAYKAFRKAYPKSFYSKLAEAWSEKHCSVEAVNIPPVPQSNDDAESRATSMQSELKRLGCYTGRIDGDWGKQSRSALTLFNTHSKAASLSFDQNALDMLRGRKGRVCPEPAVKKQLSEGSATANENAKSRATAIQRELKRLGCYSGRIDGDWGRGSRSALQRFNAQSKRAALQFNQNALNVLRSRKARTCPKREIKKRQERRAIKKKPSKNGRVQIGTFSNGAKIFIGDKVCTFGVCATATRRTQTFCVYCKTGDKSKCYRQQFYRPLNYTCGRARAWCVRKYGSCLLLKHESNIK